jgi:hypothetical protein
MTDIEDLERRVAALEASQKTEIPALRRDIRRMLNLQDDTLNHLEELNRRVAANELTAAANAKTTEEGFANVQAQIDGLREEVRTQIDGLREEVHARIDSVRGEVKAYVDGLRCDLPGMIAETLREVLAEQRRG